MLALPSLHSRLDRDPISTCRRAVKASESWGLYVALDCGKLGQGSVGPRGGHLVTSGYSENNYLSSLRKKQVLALFLGMYNFTFLIMEK